MTATVETAELEQKVLRMYRDVATEPGGEYHFELGRGLAERLGYPAHVLDSIPAGAIESFAGVGYFLDLATLREGESVVDLGSGAGMDVFFAVTQVGKASRVVGVDFTAEQLTKARSLAARGGFAHVELRDGRIERLPVDDETVDCVISNRVINLSPEKEAVFAEAARVLHPGGRLATADIVSERQLKDSIVCDADLWAACIGGAAQEDTYRQAIEAAGLRVKDILHNSYEFISERATQASSTALRASRCWRGRSRGDARQRTCDRRLHARGAGPRPRGGLIPLRRRRPRPRQASRDVPHQRGRPPRAAGLRRPDPHGARPAGKARARPVHRPGAQLQGATPLMQLAKDGATTVNHDDAAGSPFAGV